MKSSLYIAIAFSSLSVFAAAQAAQDPSQVLANRAHLAAETKSSASPQAEEQPAAPRHVMPLDHGPRAQSTPWQNQQLRLHEAQAEARARLAARPQNEEPRAN